MVSIDNRAIYVVAFISTVSLVVSLVGTYLAFSIANPDNITQGRKIYKRAIRDITDCSEEALAAYDVTTNDGSTSRHVHDLSCKYTTLQEQMESWVDEFNSMLFFINEITMNMQAAKDKINDNEQLIFLATLAADGAANSSKQNQQVLSFVYNAVETANATLKRQNVRLEGLETKTNGLEHTLQNLNASIHSASTLLEEEASETMPKVVDVDMVAIRSAVVEREGNHSMCYEALDERSQQNSEHIVNIRTSIARMKSKLSNLASGWYNAPNGYQYYLSKSAFTSNAFVRSRRYCKHRGSDLAHVGMRNPDVFRYLWHTFIAPARHHCVWIGMTDLEAEGVWKWVDGEAVDKHWANWGPRLPGRAFLQDCGLVRGGKWGEGQCTGSRKLCSFICERKILSF